MGKAFRKGTPGVTFGNPLMAIACVAASWKLSRELRSKVLVVVGHAPRPEWGK